MRRRGLASRLLKVFVFASLIGVTLPAEIALADDVDQAAWNGHKQQVVLPNGQTIRYVELGERDAPAVLLLHGISDTSRSYSLLAPYLPGMRLLIPDQRGHGQSGRPECCYAIADLAWDARLFLDALKVERAHVVGHSLGSMVAQVFAATWPERVGKLVLIASTPGPAVTRGDWLWTEGHRLMEPVDPKGEFMQALQSGPNPIDPGFRDHVVRESASMPPRVWRALLRELAQTIYAPLSPDIAAPVLILWGDKDEMFGAETQAALRKALPRAQVHTFTGLGHNLHWEHPGEVGAVMSKFLKE